MTQTRNILYCTRMNRPCTCGELTVYDRNGRIPIGDSSGMRCLTDNEVRNALVMLLDEWQRRLSTDGVAPLLLDS
jgi:hypothetical protein